MPMSKVNILVELSIHEGKLDAFKALAEKMTAGTQSESGALGYEWYFSADQKRCRLLETYADADAVLAHFMGPVVQQLVPQMLQHSAVDRFEVYGDPGAKATAMLGGFGAEIFHYWNGVRR